MFSDTPRPLVVLLALVVAGRLLLTFLVPGPMVFAFLQFAFFALFAWRTLQGKQSSAHILAVLLAISAVLTVYQVIGLASEVPIVAFIFLPWAALLACTAIYIFASKSAKAFYATKSAAAWGR